MSSFSRLQLAAALIEYDNDPTDPSKPFRSAQGSAIFAHVRNLHPPRNARRESRNHLGVSLPSDDGGMQSPQNLHARAPSSLSGLMTNPFGKEADDVEGGDGADTPQEDMEVDLASWGLDSLIPKDKEKSKTKKRDKGKGREVELPNPYDDMTRPASRATNVELDNFGAGGAFLDSASTVPAGARRRSLSSALELSGSVPERPAVRQRAMSAYALIDALPVTPPLHSVPFPTQSVRSASTGPARDNVSRGHGRNFSTASIGSRAMVNEPEDNPFAIDPPSPRRASRFDPKSASIGSMGSGGLLRDFDEDKENTFAVRPPSPSRSSRFDPKVRSRVLSTASLGSRMLYDDTASVMTGITGVTGAPTHRERPLSTMELLRPKLLVMPSPLQGANAATPARPSIQMRDGFEVRVVQDGTPLPPGARAGNRSSVQLAAPGGVPNPSNSFIPNPRSSLSLSQLIFRNTLPVDGQRDVSYADIDRDLERATEEGQQVMTTVPEEAPVRPVSVVVEDLPTRPPGKLYGRSLVDRLEERKAEMRSKQRVFYGDDRPSMMQRGSLPRSSTLIDPATLHQRPGSQVMDVSLQRRLSTGPKPLLDFDEDAPSQPKRPGASLPNTRSVFGVDTLWEREMVKLKEIEVQEEEARKIAAEKEELEAAKKNKKKKNKASAKDADLGMAAPLDPSPPPEQPSEPRVSIAPPVLPDIPRSTGRRPPPAADDDDDDESDSDSDSAGVPQADASSQKWFAGSSDDDRPSGPVRTTGVGPRFPNRGRPHGSFDGTSFHPAGGDDSEEDMPLAATVDRAMQRATRAFQQSTDAGSDSDEDVPLSTMMQKKPSTGMSLNIDFDHALGSSGAGAAGRSGAVDSDDEDNQPLGLRASRVVASRADDSDDDDKPLGLHPEQQRRTQYQLFVQQQQVQQQQQAAMQQQMLMQQMQTNMMLSNPSLMGSGFFAPPPMVAAPAPMMMPMMPPPIAGSPPPSQDSSKFNRVDQWRKGVTVDG